jgi:hypothetical protein
MSEPTRYPADRPRAATVRSRLMLEVASELVGTHDWPHKQVRIDLREQGATSWPVTLFASDGRDAVREVLAGRAQFAIINPATAIVPALRREPGAPLDALAAIATIPSYDQLGLAVTGAASVRDLAELAEAKPALTVSLRGGRPNHLVHLVIDDVLAAAGLSLADIESWGGTVRYDEGLPHSPGRAKAMRSGAIDAMFDEGVYNWVEAAASAGMRFLAITGDTRSRLDALGYRAGTMTKARHPALDNDVPTVDFSGWLIFTRRDSPDPVVAGFCEALAAARERIAWQGGPALPLERMCNDTLDAPAPLPFHPAARASWERHGLLARRRSHQVDDPAG